MNKELLERLASEYSGEVSLLELIKERKEAFKAGFDAALGLLKDEKEIDSQIEINGLLWDTENLEINGQIYFTHDEALKFSASVGKRLPTEKEFKSLLVLDREWSETDKGIWIAKDKLFLPAAGLRSNDSGAGYNQGSYGYYWSAETEGANSPRLCFNSSSANMFSSNRASGCSVRCVQDVK